MFQYIYICVYIYIYKYYIHRGLYIYINSLIRNSESQTSKFPNNFETLNARVSFLSFVIGGFKSEQKRYVKKVCQTSQGQTIDGPFLVPKANLETFNPPKC